MCAPFLCPPFLPPPPISPLPPRLSPSSPRRLRHSSRARTVGCSQGHRCTRHAMSQTHTHPFGVRPSACLLPSTTQRGGVLCGMRTTPLIGEKEGRKKGEGENRIKNKRSHNPTFIPAHHHAVWVLCVESGPCTEIPCKNTARANRAKNKGQKKLSKTHFSPLFLLYF